MIRHVRHLPSTSYHVDGHDHVHVPMSRHVCSNRNMAVGGGICYCPICVTTKSGGQPASASSDGKLTVHWQRLPLGATPIRCLSCNSPVTLLPETPHAAPLLGVVQLIQHVKVSRDNNDLAARTGHGGAALRRARGGGETGS